MPVMPQIGNDAKGELPAGNEKLRQSRGTLGLWVIRVLFVMVITIAPIMYYDLQKRLDECEERADKANERFIKKLEQLSEKINAADEKADTTLNKAIEVQQNIKPKE